ncbi:unnamed protein product [Ranitomeya imitator]|uniref:Integrin beta n=1 Tax=Ranitomeya imitator TaxID=111125 RepID=A0ABN9MFP6_9NEOB|nr:unnamed protein product [Ranitomeya imitator]
MSRSLLLGALLLCCAPPTPAAVIVCSGRSVSSVTSCQDCLRLHPQCAWCSEEVFGATHAVTSRCDLADNLLQRGCAPDSIEGPKSKVTVTKSLPLSHKGSGSSQADVIQVTPQRLSLSLRPGAAASFRVHVRQVQDYPVDLYYLMDLSLSMKDDLDTIRNLGTRLAAEMATLTSNFRLGFGTFVEKNVSPFSYTAPKISAQPLHRVQAVPQLQPVLRLPPRSVSLTDKVSNFNTEVQNQQVSRNRDAPEGAFDAILQAAVCKEEVGWRTEASHLLVITTDDVPHVALDGKLAGLVQPHDGQCHLNMASEYSAAAQLVRTAPAPASDNQQRSPASRAVCAPCIEFHGADSGTTVEILDPNSQNILQLIVNAYNTVQEESREEAEHSAGGQTALEHSLQGGADRVRDPDDLGLSFSATCQDGVSYPGVKKCGELRIGDTVSFEVSAEARSCPPPGVLDTFTIKPVGFRDVVEVAVTYDCSCRCSQRVESNSGKCSSNGNYSCGMCNCDAGFLGARCECGEEDDSSDESLTTCRESDSHTVCNGRGRCICGLCSCYESEFGRISGSYCQCDDFSCARFKGVLCSGESCTTVFA